MWGEGAAGIRAWKAACLEWLAAHPGMFLPAGGQLGVLRETVRLLQAT